MSESLRLNVPTALEYFASLVAEDAGLNLLEAAAAIAQDEFPALDVEAVLSEVETLALRLSQRLPADASARHKLQALTRFFHHELGFAGNVNNYYECGNSFIHHVLATRRGIPVTLAVLFLELAGHLGLRAQGLAFPGHFLVKVKMGNGEVVLDPCTGNSLSRERLDEYLQVFRDGAGLAGEVALPIELFMQAASPRDILVRILRNLKEIYRAGADWPRLLPVQQRLVVLLPGDAAERRDRGLALEALGQWRAALEDLNFYVEQAPQAADGQDLQRRLMQMRQRGVPPLQ
jgi:regulator of sirC expression with transglutaminase-like and TPR domain